MDTSIYMYNKISVLFRVYTAFDLACVLLDGELKEITWYVDCIVIFHIIL